MFGLIQLMGEKSESIALATRKNNPINNEVQPSPSKKHQKDFEKLLSQNHSWQRRKPCVGVYNCTGHVWASRRTAIFEEEEWRKILADDEYRRLASNEPPKVGDLVLYKYEYPNFSEFVHVARIVELRPFLNLSLPWVVSKLGTCGGEVLHKFDEHPFGKAETETEFWTDRPKED